MTRTVIIDGKPVECHIINRYLMYELGYDNTGRKCRVGEHSFPQPVLTGLQMDTSFRANGHLYQFNGKGR